jgi:hypothetical protein
MSQNANTLAPRLPKPRVQQPFINVLPSRYKTWLKFYDAIPVEYRDEKQLRQLEEVSRSEFLQLYPEQAADADILVVFYVEYRIDREWMLARIAEELLPARMIKSDINTLESALHQASKYDSSVLFAKRADLLTPLWQVSRDK